MPIRNSRLSSTAVITEIDSGDPTNGTSQGGAARKWSGYIRAAMPSAKEIPSTNTLRESSIREAIIWIAEVTRKLPEKVSAAPTTPAGIATSEDRKSVV